MTHPPQDQAAIQRMWHAFRQAAGVDAELSGAFAFGDNPAMADDLSELVLHGPKRATAGLELAYERENEAVPRPGDHWVVVDGQGQPVCVIRTTEVQIKPLNQVDAAFAWDEGEGDRSLAYWQEAHRRFFTRYCQQVGVPFADDLPVVLERFEVVWPAR
jgi:uncharacterized protein YhfF